MAEKFLDKVGAAFETAAKETEKAARIGKLKLDKLALERERDRLFRRLGKEVYLMMEAGKEIGSAVPEMEGFRNEIKKLEKNIESKVSKMQEVKNE